MVRGRVRRNSGQVERANAQQQASRPPPLPGPLTDNGGRIAEGVIVRTPDEKYELIRRIGGGGMGIVYSATELRTGTTVAIKFILEKSISGLDDDEKKIAIERFKREANVAVRVKHPYVIETKNFGYHGGLPFLVLEYFPGEDLHRILGKVEDGSGKSTMTWEWLGPMMMRACEGLHAAHSQNIMHRDIKPGNLMVAMEETEELEALRPIKMVKVLDFGLAKYVYEQGAGRELTRDGIIAGTWDYMAPEQVEDEKIDHRIDVYSVGAVMYRAMTGRPPFPPDSETQAAMLAALLRRTKEMPVRPTLIRPDIPIEAEGIILKAMAIDRKDRYPTALEFREAIRQSLGYVTPQPKPKPSTLAEIAPVLREEKRRSGVKKTLIAIAVAAVLGTGAVVIGYETNSWMRRKIDGIGRFFSGSDKKKENKSGKAAGHGTPVKKSYVAKITSTPSRLDVVRIVKERRMVKGRMRDVEKEINLGKTPLQTVLPPGAHKLKVMRRGYIPIKLTVSEDKPNCEASFYKRWTSKCK